MTLTLAQKIDLAKSKTKRLVDHAQELLAIHENNAIIVYSSTLSSQIPTSHAANAFNIFQRSLHSFELIRLCAIWDKPDSEKESIPTVIELIRDDDIIEHLAGEMRSHWIGQSGVLLNPSADAELNKQELAVLRDHEVHFAEEQANQVRTVLRNAISEADRVSSSSILSSVKNHRDKYLAHSLSMTHREKSGPVPPAKFGMEASLLQSTLAIIQNLHLGVNGTGFDFEDARAIDKGDAEALWTGCKFTVLR